MAGIEDQHERPATGADLGAGQQQAHHLTPRELSWRPDSHSTSESAKHWQEGNTVSRCEKLTVDAHGMYAVTDVDALSTIAERNLHTHGTAKPSEKALRHEMDRIIALNKDEYPDLGRNPDLLHPGMELRLRHHHKSHPSHIDIPPLHQPDNQAPALPRPLQLEAPAAPAPAPALDAAPAPYQAPTVPQPYAGLGYAPPQSADAGQGIANFFGSLIGGIGGGILGAAAFGRGYDYPGYRRHWDQFDLGLGGYDQGLSTLNPGQVFYNQDNGAYGYGWPGEYNQPWRNHYRRGR